MATDYWKNSPFGEESIFHPSWDEKELGIKYLHCQKDKNFTYLFFDIMSRNLSSDKAIVTLVETEILFDETVISREFPIDRNGTKSIYIKFDEKMLSKSFLEGEFEFVATVTCDGLSATTGEFRIKCVNKPQEANNYENKKENTNETIFKKLYSSGELTPKEIREYRNIISTIDKEQRSVWYLELQKHVPYHSQMDNDNTDAARMCNLTSLAMNLESLGIECPDPTMQFEDWLEKKREEKGYPKRTESESWIKLANDLGVKSERIEIWTKKSDSVETIRKKVYDEIMPYIENGHSVSLSAFTLKSDKGHVVRIQSVNEDGIIVDDPYGRVNNFQEREKGGSGYSGSINSKDNLDIFGKDNLWRWEDIKICTIKYIVVFYKTENEND